jgi:thiol peroxidase
MLGPNPAETNGPLPKIGSTISFTLADQDLADVGLDAFPGKKILNVFPSVNTGICAASVRNFNEKAGGMPGVTVLNISMDLPFAQKEFCAAAGLEGVHTLSAFRSSFLRDNGLLLVSSKFAGLAARAVLVLDASNTVVYVALSEQIGAEPDYAGALAAVG